MLKGAYGGDHDHAGRCEPSHAAFYIKELFCAEVSAKACFGYGVIAGLHGKLSRKHGVAAMRDVSEGASVDKCRRSFERLYKVRVDGVLQQSSHGSGSVEVIGCHRLAVPCVCADDPAYPVL